MVAREFARSRHILFSSAPPADARIHYGSDPLQFGDLRLPPGQGPHPVVIFLHGGRFHARYDLEHVGQACLALTSAGVATWNVEYRRLETPGGGWPNTFKDAGLAADFLRDLAPQYGLDLDHVVAVGHSAGGCLVLWLAGRHHIARDSELFATSPLPLSGVVALAPVSDLRRVARGDGRRHMLDLLGGTPEESPERYAAASPTDLLPTGVPTVLVHGTEDTLPLDMSQNFRDRARRGGDDVSLLPLEGAGHYELIDPGSEEWPRVAAEVLRLAGRGAV
jgi:acetyl esterase/lipase